MGRIARVVVPGVPHHITQRGNGRKTVFDDVLDHQIYLKLLRANAAQFELKIWAWCLMPNHVHLLAIPQHEFSLARALGRTHAEYALFHNARQASSGHLWQARYYSCPVDRGGIWPVMAYIERNPLRAGLVERAEDFQWSSATTHVRNRDDGWMDMSAWRLEYSASRWREVLELGVDDEALRERLREATRAGRPFGPGNFVEQIERSSNRILQARPPGRPKKMVIECTVPN